MTEAKHTPGPWEAITVFGEWYVVLKGTTEKVCNKIWGFERAEANARLIAAAPDMLTALTNLAETADFLADEANLSMADNAIAAARAAIAKTTGEA